MSNKGYPLVRRKMMATMTDVSSNSNNGCGRESDGLIKRANKTINKIAIVTLCGIGILIFILYMSVFANSKAQDNVHFINEKKTDISNGSSSTIRHGNINHNQSHAVPQYDGLSNSKLCISAVERLVELKILLVALDFDLTIIDIHTHGMWEEDGNNRDELVRHVRPEIECLITESLARGLHIAVTSFSQQEILMKNVMKRLLTEKIIPYLQQQLQQEEDSDHSSSKVDIATIQIPVFGGRNREENNGKRKQLQKAMDDINKNFSSSTKHHENDGQVVQVTVTPQNIILIDDNSHNIRMASKDGYYSVWLDPDHYREVGVDNDDDKLFQSIIAIVKA